MAERYRTCRPTVRRAIAELARQKDCVAPPKDAAPTYAPAPTAAPSSSAGDSTSTCSTRTVAARQGRMARETAPRGHRATANTASVTDSSPRPPATRPKPCASTPEKWILYRFSHWRHRKNHRVIAITLSPATDRQLIGAPPKTTDRQRTTSSLPAQGAATDGETPQDADDRPSPTKTLPALHACWPQHGPVTFTTTVTARMPRSEELSDLGTEPGTPLLVIRRTMTDPHGHPLEDTQIEAPADRIEALSADPGTRTPTAILTF